MTVETHHIELGTQGNTDIIDITGEVRECIDRGKIRDGVVVLFVTGSTAAISTTEYEPGLVNRDLRDACERVASESGEYLHEQTWHDDNGHSHVRATFIGPSLTVPLIKGQLPLGTWQQIILLDFDTRPRTRRIVVQVSGE